MGSGISIPSAEGSDALSQAAHPAVSMAPGPLSNGTQDTLGAEEEWPKPGVQPWLSLSAL